MKGAPAIKILFVCLCFLLFLFIAAFAGSDGFLRVEGAIPSLIVH